MDKKIYLDNNAGAPLDPRIASYLTDLMPSLQGNPSSSHAFGQTARALISKSRALIASYLNVKSNELIWTSGGTESVNMAIQGLVSGYPKGHIVTSAVEHSCVIAACKRLEQEGHEVTFLKPGPWGAVLPEAVHAAIRPNTQLIALMSVNNETGVKTDIESMAKIAQDYDIPFFVDGVAQLGKEKIAIPQGVSAMAFSGHKIHALQGIGLLFLRGRVKFQPLMLGGEQELGRRPGTENVLGIVSMAKAVELLSETDFARIHSLREKFESTLLHALPKVMVNGEGPRFSNVSNLAFLGIDGETFLINLDRMGIAASHGSACSSGSLEPSRVLLGMGLPMERVNASIRFSFSRLNTSEEIEEACKAIVGLVNGQRT